jgi:flagellar motor switch protein FliN/FliY
MNAVPPKGQMPGKGAALKDEHIHLTMSFEAEDMAAEPAEAERAGDDGHPADLAGQRGEDFAQPGGPRRAGAASAGRTARDRAGDGILPQFAGIELVLTVEVGSLNIPLKDLVSVEPGQLLALDRMTSEPVSVLVNGKAFARGEIVAVGERYGVRLLEILPPGGGAG